MYFILLLALFLRLVNLNQPLWLDEAIQYQAVSQFSLPQMLSKFMPTDFNPPLSYIINFFFSRLFGYSETALRLPSVIFGVLTVWLVYKLGGKLPALLLATSGLHIYYSQEARMYALAALAVTASFYFLKKKQWLGYIFASLAALYSHYLTVFIFPAQIAYVKKKSWLWLGLGFLPWLPVFLKQFNAGRAAAATAWGGVVGGLSLKNLALIPVKFLAGRISIDNNYLFAAVLALPLALAFWLIIKGVKQNKLFAAWLIVPAVLIAAVSVFIPVLAYFRLLFLLPAFYLLIALGPKKIVYGLIVFNFAASAVYLFDPGFHREDWRQLARSIPDGPAVIIPAVSAPLKYYYAGEISGTDAVPENNFSYIPYAEPIFDPGQDFRRRASEAGFTEVSVSQFRGGLTLIEYKQ